MRTLVLKRMNTINLHPLMMFGLTLWILAISAPVMAEDLMGQCLEKEPIGQCCNSIQQEPAVKSAKASILSTTDQKTLNSALPILEAEKEWGIRIEGIRITGAGSMLDFRYRITNPEKATVLNKRENKPYLIDQKSGAKMFVPHPPKVGAMRNSHPPIKGRTYFILFGNPGHFIKMANTIAIVIGDFKVKDIIVE